MKGADIFDYIDQEVKDGVEGLRIHGVPKSGKSNMARRINKDCMLRHKENLIMPGTVNCEWRNLLYHKSKPVLDFKVLLPLNFKDDLFFYNIPHDIEKHFLYVDYENIDLEEYLKHKERNLLVIYDNHFRDDYFHKRIAIWNEIGKQLNDRTFQVEKAIGLSFDEGGIYFPQIAIGDHYKEVYRFSNLVVDYRKNNVRLQLLSQLDSQMLNTIKDNQFWVILKKGLYSKRIDKRVRKVTPFYAIDQYVILEGGIFTRGNRIVKMKEAPKMFKIKPTRDYIEEDSPKNGSKAIEQRNSLMRHLKSEGLTERAISDLSGLSHGYVHKIVSEA